MIRLVVLGIVLAMGYSLATGMVSSVGDYLVTTFAWVFSDY